MTKSPMLCATASISIIVCAGAQGYPWFYEATPGFPMGDVVCIKADMAGQSQLGFDEYGVMPPEKDWEAQTTDELVKNCAKSVDWSGAFFVCPVGAGMGLCGRCPQGSKPAKSKDTYWEGCNLYNMETKSFITTLYKGKSCSGEDGNVNMNYAHLNYFKDWENTNIDALQCFVGVNTKTVSFTYSKFSCSGDEIIEHGCTDSLCQDCTTIRFSAQQSQNLLLGRCADFEPSTNGYASYKLDANFLNYIKVPNCSAIVVAAGSSTFPSLGMLGVVLIGLILSTGA